MSTEFSVNIYAADDPGSVKLPPKVRAKSDGSSVSMVITSENANSAPHWQATAMLLAGNSFLQVADGSAPGDHADKLRAAASKLQSLAADLVLQGKR